MTNNHNQLFLTPTSRFHALQTRNPLASCAFIYSVLTTKIYCRPTCPSRLARRANIVFHNTPADALAAGFRACKRCKPDSDGEGKDQQVLMVRKVVGLIEGEEGGRKWSVKALAKEVGWTESHFCRVFKRVSGRTVGEFRGDVQGRRAQTSSTPTGVPVEGVTTATSIQDPSKKLLVENQDLTVGCVDFDFSNYTFDLDGDDCGFLATESELVEDCFEFFDFGSPPPLVLPV